MIFLICWRWCELAQIIGETFQHFADVFAQRRNLTRFGSIRGIILQHVAVVAYGDTATGRSHHNRFGTGFDQRPQASMLLRISCSAASVAFR
jgi:hypothetical protein